MAKGAEAKVRARLMALMAALESRDTETEGVASIGRARLGAMQHQGASSSEGRKRQDEAKRIQLAIGRLEEGKYGYCAACGSAIEDKRLEADPATIHCAKCGGDQQ